MKPTFSLLSKVTGIKYTQYKGDVTRLSKFPPYSVDEVVVGVSNSKQVRKITTFRDSDGRIVERVFDYPRRLLKNKLYSQVDNTIGTDEYVESKTVKEYTIDKVLLPYYKEYIKCFSNNRLLFWKNNRTVTNHVSYNVNKDEIILTQVKTQNKKRSTLQHNSFTEYPRIKLGKKINTQPKNLEFDINLRDYSVFPKSFKGNVEFPVEDKYLGYRALTIEDAKIPFTNRFLNETNMSDKEIKINPSYNPIHENGGFNAIFNAENGSINFNQDADFYSKSKLVSTSRHEVEHSRQYFLQGLLNQGDTPWQTDMAEKFGQITDKKQLKEAKRYDKAIKDYVPYYIDEAKYKHNYIEVKARQKGKEEQEKYDFDGQTVRKIFNHIPSKLL